MAGMIVGNCSITVVEHRYGSMHVDGYQDRLAMVISSLERGSLGDGVSGSAAHVAALRAIILRAEHVIESIENPPKPSCNRHDDCDAADAKAQAAGRLGAEHCHDDCCEDCFGA